MTDKDRRRQLLLSELAKLETESDFSSPRPCESPDDFVSPLATMQEVGEALATSRPYPFVLLWSEAGQFKCYAAGAFEVRRQLLRMGLKELRDAKERVTWFNTRLAEALEACPDLLEEFGAVSASQDGLRSAGGASVLLACPISDLASVMIGRGGELFRHSLFSRVDGFEEQIVAWLREQVR